MALECGKVFAGDFRIERELSRGGMGEVYVATQLSTGRERALKVMRPELVQDESLRKRFEQEAKVGGKIKSDHVVEVVAAGVDDATGMPWLAMELLEGESLAELVDRKAGLSIDEARDVLAHLAHALSAAHAVGVVHRDLKPDNVFVARARRASERSVVKVLDFGIAKVVAEMRATATAPIGTLFWMAPEQAETDGAIGPETDVWAFGLLAFYLLSGRTFWDEKASVAALMKKLVVEPIPLATERAGAIGVERRLPFGFDGWLSRCLARAPKERFATIARANDELQHLLGASSASFAPTEPHVSALSPPRDATGATRASRKPGAIIAAAIVAVVAIVAFFVAARPSVPPVASATPPAPSPLSAPPVASASCSVLEPGDKEDHETIHRVPLGDSPRRGGAHPLVTIVEFGDFQCPYTRGGEEGVKKLLDAYGDDIAVVWKDYVFDLHPIAEPAARLARLARVELGDDGFWRAHDRLFAACAANDPAMLEQLGRDLGLAPAKVRAALAGPTPDAVEADIRLAMDIGELGLPSYFINGRQVSGNTRLENGRPLIEEELAKAKALLASGVARERIYDAIQEHAATSKPKAPVVVDVPDDHGPVLVGAHALVDVHQFGDETDMFTGLSQRVADYVLREYGDKIRFHWHAVPDAKSERAMRVAAASDFVYHQSGSAVFWKFHRALLDNQEWPFKDASHKNPRGFADDTLVEYARQAGASAL